MYSKILESGRLSVADAGLSGECVFVFARSAAHDAELDETPGSTG